MQTHIIEVIELDRVHDTLYTEVVQLLVGEDLSRAEIRLCGAAAEIGYWERVLPLREARRLLEQSAWTKLQSVLIALAREKKD